jgi:hypothetical protein
VIATTMISEDNIFAQSAETRPKRSRKEKVLPGYPPC